MKPPAQRPGTQYAVLPFRRSESAVEVMLVTSRDTRRWVIPKGWPMKGRKAHAAAAREALEEAGVKGKVSKHPIGAYAYLKRLANGAPMPVQVRVFPLEVIDERARWVEMAERERRWFNAEEAADAVAEPELRALIRAFAASPPRPRTSKR